MKNRKIIPALLLSVLLSVLLCGCSEMDEILRMAESMQAMESSAAAEPSEEASSKAPAPEGTFRSHYIDVGQGDCEYLEFPDGTTMLIDAGPPEAGETIRKYLESYGCSRIDYLVATHPHSDHIGSMKTVVESFEIGKIYMPKATATTKTYENLLTAIKAKGLKISTAKAGVKIKTDEAHKLEVKLLGPVGTEYESLNNYSAVVSVHFGERSFLYMGDAEKLSENEILDKKYDVKADVIKIGHHGSNSSSGAKFIKAVGAAYGILSMGADNAYGHPHKEPVQRWEKSGTKLYRTDQSGSIVAVSDGKTLEITTEK